MQPGRRLIAVRSMMVLLAANILVVAAPAAPAAVADYMAPKPPHRLALVISNASYPSAPLTAAPSDAIKITKALSAAGFDVTPASDVATQADLVSNVLNPFLNKVKRGDIVLIYYFGHGFSHGNDNFLMPVAASTAVSEDDIYDDFLPERAIREKASERQPGLVLLFLDACRVVIQFNNPGAPAPLVAQSLPSQNEQGDIAISYAADYGDSAYAPNATSVSYYTDALATTLPVPGTEFSTMLRSLNTAVASSSGYQQRAWISSDLETLFYFVPTADIQEGERQLWTAALQEGTREAVTNFLHGNRGSIYAGQAIQWLADNPVGQPGPRLTFTQISPLSPEAMWNPAAKLVVLPKISTTLGVPRKATLGDHDDVRSFANASPDQLFSMAQTAIVTARTVKVGTATAGPVNLPFGKTIDLSRLSSGELLATTRFDDIAKVVTLAKSSPDAGQLKVGRALAEVQLAPDANLADIISDNTIRDQLLPALAKAKVIGWVSISTGHPNNKRDQLLLSLQATFVRYQLIAHGVAESKISVVENDVSNTGPLRVRIFGTSAQ